MQITRTEQSQLPRMRRYWEAARSYQIEQGLPSWGEFPANLIMEEIDRGTHFTAHDHDSECIGYFSLALSDAEIWGEDEKDDAIYIHRMCVNPAKKGRKFTDHVLSWAYGYAAAMRKRFVRMDTWAANEPLVAYYMACGFKHVRNKQLGSTPNLLGHYNNIVLALFQNDVQGHSDDESGRPKKRAEASKRVG